MFGHKRGVSIPPPVDQRPSWKRGQRDGESQMTGKTRVKQSGQDRTAVLESSWKLGCSAPEGQASQCRTTEWGAVHELSFLMEELWTVDGS